ncbi:TetR/AcrR family transcriptional regulator [Leucobacter sp. CX42]|uniref:TetR/AcrR family transcriptional regulator n=1 Tax=unclassified Leucobacter TaxID=2621730 RepID=UPI00333F256F
MTLTTTGDVGVRTEQRARPGRPRVHALEERALAAAVSLIDSGEEVTVTRVVDLSGVSRAALYRRWPSITSLIAAALDVGHPSYPEVSDDADLRAVITQGFLPSTRAPGVVMTRFQHRMRLILVDPSLQRTYWESHVARRRRPLEEALRRGVATGQLRPGLDVEATLDAVAGVVYYQLIVRGDDITSPETRQRLETAFDIIWAGIAMRD